MYNIGEYRKKPDRLSDRLPWGGLVAPGVILNKDGSFQRSFRFRGPDLDSATESELVAVSARVNNAFKRLGSGWALFAEAQRTISDSYPDSTFDNVLAFLIDEERRAAFRNRDHFESHYYLTLLYLPPTEKTARFASWFVSGPSRPAVDYRQHLEQFITETNRIADLITGFFPEIRPLSDQETLTYLHSTVSPKRHPVAVPEVPLYLDAILADTPLTGGFEPALGDTRLRTISVLGYPGLATPGILDGLNRLAMEYRWSTRFICMDKVEALREVKKYKQRWYAKRKSVGQLIKEGITNAESIMTDSDATNKAQDADSALQELADDLVSYGYFSASVTVFDQDPTSLEQKVRAVEQTINGLGFVTIAETINAVDAWFGSLPGHARANVRKPLLNSLNLSRLMPLSAIWAGPERNRHLDGPPLMHTVTSGNTPFRLSLHVGDVGHTMIIGPTGSGKDVLLATLETQFLRYPGAQVYIFDKGGSSRVVTAGVGGDFYDLGAAAELAFQPLARIDEEAERGWCSQWVIDLLQQEKVEITPVVKAEVWGTLTSLASSPVEQRTVSGFRALIQNRSIREALTPYSLDGPLGNIFDADHDTLAYARWQSFEMETLMGTPAAIVPALTYLFHRLEERFSAAIPTTLTLNEAWIFFDNPIFSPRIRSWLKELRKRNVSVIFATQNLSDVENCPISSALIESCPNRIFLPNDKAFEEETAAVYRRFGLNDRQLQILALSQPKKHYYYQSSQGNRLFELGLGPVALAFCAATGKEDQNAAKAVMEQYGKESFSAAWLECKKIPWATDWLEKFSFNSEPKGARYEIRMLED